MSREYAKVLKARSVDGLLRVEPSLDHNNIVFRAPVFQEVVGLIGDVEGPSAAAP
jgi:hypothetical protein